VYYLNISEVLLSVSSFKQRHPGVTREQHERFRGIEERLWFNQTAGPDLETRLIVHADAGLAAMTTSS
jgi:hypothetical protein